MIVAVANTKGGVGKTTTTLNLAIMRALTGRRVLAVDGDSQGTLQDAIGQREVEPQIALSFLPDGKQLRQQVLLAKDVYDDIIIDVGGRDSTGLRAAILLSDLVLVPFQPRSFDVWALANIKSVVDEALTIRDSVDVKAFICMADSRGSDNQDSVGQSPFPVLDVLVGDRKAIPNAASFGKAVVETDPSSKAAEEFIALFNAVFMQSFRNNKG